MLVVEELEDGDDDDALTDEDADDDQDQDQDQDQEEEEEEEEEGDQEEGAGEGGFDGDSSSSGDETSDGSDSAIAEENEVWSPRPIAALCTVGVVELAAGSDALADDGHTLALTERGTVLSLGAGHHGQLGLGLAHDAAPNDGLPRVVDYDWNLNALLNAPSQASSTAT